MNSDKIQALPRRQPTRGNGEAEERNLTDVNDDLNTWDVIKKKYWANAKKVVRDIKIAIKNDVLSDCVSRVPNDDVDTVEAFRRKIGLPKEIKNGGLFTNLYIPTIVKVQLVNYVVDRLRAFKYTDDFIISILALKNQTQLGSLYNGSMAKDAVACYKHFTLRTTKLKDLRKELTNKHMPEFSKTGLVNINKNQWLHVSINLVNNVGLTRYQMRKLFGLKKCNDSLLDRFTCDDSLLDCFTFALRVRVRKINSDFRQRVMEHYPNQAKCT